MYKKLIILSIALMAGLAWTQQEPADSSTASTSTSHKRTSSEVLTMSSSSEKKARKLPVSATIKAQFVPQERIDSELYRLFGSTKKQVLVAMYWITDDIMVNKLISLKKRGIDIQIIFDESSDSSLEGNSFLINKLLSNNILPIVYPSKVTGNLMHNKFLVIDNMIVLTGSANFTKKAFRSPFGYSNYENIVVIDSENIAHEYHQIFSDIKEDTLKLYIATIQKGTALPQWMQILLPKLYQEENRLKELISSQWETLNPREKNNLQKFFGQENLATETI